MYTKGCGKPFLRIGDRSCFPRRAVTGYGFHREPGGCILVAVGQEFLCCGFSII
jgi:hypothetical protein